MSFLNESQKQNIVTEIDVLFGDDRPWYGFEKLDPPTTPGQEGRMESAWLTYRRGQKGTSYTYTKQHHLTSVKYLHAPHRFTSLATEPSRLCRSPTCTIQCPKANAVMCPSPPAQHRTTLPTHYWRMRLMKRNRIWSFSREISSMDREPHGTHVQSLRSSQMPSLIGRSYGLFPNQILHSAHLSIVSIAMVGNFR